jgi:hypothetical protein
VEGHSIQNLVFGPHQLEEADNPKIPSSQLYFSQTTIDIIPSDIKPRLLYTLIGFFIHDFILPGQQIQ